MNLTNQEIKRYQDDGFLLVSNVFDPTTVDSMIDHYMAMRAEGPKPGDMGGDPGQADDPLNKYPRMINMHAWDRLTEFWAKEPKISGILRQLFNDEPVLIQTMLYFKPPRARGQAHHQDQQIITLDPLIGVWVALDEADHDNGRMTLFAGSHKLGLLPVAEADSSVSFTIGGTVLPQGIRETGIDMKPGDVLFFAGKTVHGSHPNLTTDRWRRSFICHYIAEHSEKFTPDPGTHMSYLNLKPK